MTMFLFGLSVGAIQFAIHYGLYRFVGNKWLRMILSGIVAIMGFLLLTNVSPVYMDGIDSGNIGLWQYFTDMAVSVGLPVGLQYFWGSWNEFKNITK